MVNPFLTNKALSDFLKSLNVSEEIKAFWLAKIPQLDEEEREKLFHVLKDVYLLELEEKEAIERVKKFWELFSE